jgi:two-component system, LytTR family, response regulator
MQHNNAILISHAAGAEIISNNTIVRVEAISNYSKLYFSCGRTLVVAKVLKWFDTELAGQGFIRIHRRHLVNQNSVTMLQGNFMRLQNNEVLQISKRKITKTKQYFQVNNIHTSDLHF